MRRRISDYLPGRSVRTGECQTNDAISIVDVGRPSCFGLSVLELVCRLLAVGCSSASDVPEHSVVAVVCSHLGQRRLVLIVPFRLCSIAQNKRCTRKD